MPGASPPGPDEAGSSGPADMPRALATDAASSDNLVGVAQPDTQQQQETWVRYSTLQQAQLLPEWKQQDSLLAKASVGFGQPRVSNLSQQSDSALPQSASLRLVQAPAAFNRPIVQRKLFKPPFVVRLELCYQGRIDLVVTVTVHVLNDSQYANPGAWQPYIGPGQPDLEGHLITRRLRIPSVFTTAEQDSHLTTPGSLRTHAEDFEFSELNFVKSSRMSKRWLLFSCLFFKEEPIFVLYKLPTVIISRRTDQYSKAYENLMGQVPQQGIPRSRANAVPKGPSGADGPQAFAALQMLHQYRKGIEALEGSTPTALEGSTPTGALSTHEHHERNKTARGTWDPVKAGGTAAQWHELSPEQQAAAWILQQYASLSFTRALTHADLAALESCAEAGGNSPSLSPKSWDDFQDWFCKVLKGLKQCEAEWNETMPPCISGFAMDRAAAETALRFEPVGAFLVRMCPEPGLFAISCQTSQDLQGMRSGCAAAAGFASAGGKGSVEHRLVDCVDLQRRPLWHHVLVCPAATHLLDPSSHRLYPKNQVHHRLATPLGDPQTAPTPSSMGADQLLTLAAQLQTHNSSGAQPGSVGYHLDPNAFSLPGVPCALTDPVPHAHSEKDHAHSDAVVDSATQHVRGVPQSQGPDGNVPDIQPRMQALLAGLQAQVAGPAADVHVSTARHGTASASQMQEQEDAEQQPAQQQQRQAQQQQQQQQQQWQQQTIKQASPSPERHLQHSTDVTESLNGQQAGLPDSANAVLQQLLQQSRAPQLWPADKDPQSRQTSAYSYQRKDSVSG
ncbi:hypothetical protein ABBQ32_012087 [Trebouxia sp. C0010 RCD-2024]